MARGVEAQRRGIIVEVMEAKYAQWQAGSADIEMTLPWAHDAVGRAMRIPDFVRGMTIREVERCAEQSGAPVTRAMGAWTRRGSFHPEANPSQYDPY